MGEIDTKPIESVRAALSLFEEKTDHLKKRVSGTDKDSEKKRELEGVLKDLANYKVQLEAKDAAYMQALLKLQHHQYTADELSALLENIEFERDKYVEECKEARAQIYQLEFKVKEMADQLTETLKVREQLMHVFGELKATQAELLSMETKLADTRDSELKALTQAELMETAFVMEKERAEELLKHVSELSEAMVMSRVAASEGEKEKLAILSAKDAEIEVAIQAALLVQEQLEDSNKQMAKMEELENQLQAKSSFIEMLQLEIKQVNENLSFSEMASSDAMNDLKQLEKELEEKERKISDQGGFIRALEMELNQLKLELIDASQVANSLKRDVEVLTEDLQKAIIELGEMAERENNAQVEIAMLESELHRGRSKIAAAEAAEARTENVKSGLYLAIQQLAIEAETAKNENRMLKQGADSADAETDKQSPLVDFVEVSEIGELKEEAEEQKDENYYQVTISLKEYESLVKKAEQADQIPLSLEEGLSRQFSFSAAEDKSESLKKELEAAMEKVAQFRNRAEQATTRADLAERAKERLEDQIRIWREVKQKRKAALAALREVSLPKQFSPPEYESPGEFKPPAHESGEEFMPHASEETHKKRLQLREVLKMKF
ncbi:WEB family protein [Pyrus ussuriensis x Pyrus communis]|uniref:WEB family protein n=1 Tax=Pyrus ussuriensis x Pyrus communis TaxID=2448454 RepID=A0A5N5IDW9_9ROSA|nr:WEB family protein [Pyrus ussuriensis x Pyrus communis]